MAAFPPRLPEESASAYEGFTLYCRMGTSRSTANVQREVSKSKRWVDEWSRRYKWVERAREYDEALSLETAQAVTDDYVGRVKAHQERYLKAGNDLHSAATMLLAIQRTRLNALAQRLADPLTREETAALIDSLSPQALGQIGRSFAVAADLEAHALGLERLLKQNADEPDNEQ